MINFKDLNINKKIITFIFINLILVLFGISFSKIHLNKSLPDIQNSSVFYKNIFIIFYLILTAILQYFLFKIYIIIPIINLLLNIEKSKEKNSFTKINSSDEIGKISMEFSLAKEMLKNNKIILDNTIKIKTAEIELANEELKDLNFQSEKREKFLETLFEAIPFPIFYKNEHFRYIKCNTAFADFLGKSKKEIYGKTVYDISPARLAEVYHKEDKKLFENGIVQKYNSFVEDRHGYIRTVIFNKSLCIYNEKKIGIVGLITDSSEKQDYSLIL